jgi:hypothetical protein
MEDLDGNDTNLILDVFVFILTLRQISSEISL